MSHELCQKIENNKNVTTKIRIISEKNQNFIFEL